MASRARGNPAEALRQFELQGVKDTGKVIGEGGYGTVKELTFHGLKCVGKKIHSLVWGLATPLERDALLERFANECELLSQLHHPCIVQCLGVYFERGSDPPVLVMEYLHTTLAECLNKGVPPEEITYEILRDVILGLRYLHEHSPPITHRDLSANNILLTPHMSAKISDLGVAKILNLAPSRMSQITPQTQMPGTPCYMPPEAMVAQPKYTNKVDIFSFGVMMVHILSGQWPIPGVAFREDPNDPDSITLVSEFDRRAEFLQQIPQDHPLMGLIRRCLSNVSSRRPEAAVVYQSIRSILSGITTSYVNRLEMLQQNTSLTGQVETLSAQVEALSGEVNTLRGSMSQSSEALRAQVERLSITHSSRAGPVQGDRMALKPAVDDSLTKATGLPWETFCGQWNITGYRQVFLLASIGKISHGKPDIIPLQKKGQLSTEEDLQKLRSEGIPGHCRDDLSIVRARYVIDPRCQLYREEVSTTGMELGRDYVMQQLEQFFNSVEQNGAVIYYIGHGKKGTGDWCFKDGFITFRDILHLYNTTKIKGRVLTIASNCSYSGTWVKECCRYLDEQGITSCGHSAAEKDILLKVFASCKPSEMANTLVFSARAMGIAFENKTITFLTHKEIHPSQHVNGMNYTSILCGKAPHDPCTRQSPEYTWMKRYQGLRSLVWCVRDKVAGRPRWRYVLLEDDDERIRIYKEIWSTLSVNDYVPNLVLKSGWGQDPPDEVKREMYLLYGIPYTL